jgi:hypothetical protein
MVQTAPPTRRSARAAAMNVERQGRAMKCRAPNLRCRVHTGAPSPAVPLGACRVAAHRARKHAGVAHTARWAHSLRRSFEDEPIHVGIRFAQPLVRGLQKQSRDARFPQRGGLTLTLGEAADLFGNCHVDQ